MPKKSTRRGTSPVRSRRSAGRASQPAKSLLFASLELLRKTDAFTSKEEAEIVAAYEQGSAAARAQLAELLEKMREAHFGPLTAALRSQKKGLQREGRFWAAPGRSLVQTYKGDLQEFLDRNQPTVEAVERASTELAGAARVLAAGLKGAGRDAADELLRRGRRALHETDTTEIEQAFFEGSLRTLPRLERGLRRFFFGFGLFFVALGVLFLAFYVPALRPVALMATAGLSILLGLSFMVWGLRIGRALRRQEGELARWSAMSSQERRQRLADRLRKERTPTAPNGPKGSQSSPSFPSESTVQNRTTL